MRPIIHQAGVTTQDQVPAGLRDFVTAAELDDILAAYARIRLA
jgi:hypothetical protein